MNGTIIKERPILFNAEMVNAIISGRKTQTRRIVKDQRVGDMWSVKPAENPSFERHTHDWWLPTGTKPYSALACPFGKIGDRLWVRETWTTLGNEDACPIDWNENLLKAGGPEAARIYRASCEQKPSDYGLWSIPDDAFWKPHTDNMKFEGAWTPSIHMPRWASRITLEISDIRIERLNAITEEDAKAEGVIPSSHPITPPAAAYRVGFANLWREIYSDDEWKKNPWVWVIEFKRVDGDEA